MFRLRPASIDDLATLLHHRTEMFREMGFTDATLLDEVTSAAATYFKKALPDGTYRAWLMETEDGVVAGGGGLLIAPWPGFPGEKQSRRAWILNMYTEPTHRRQGIAKRLVETMIEWCRTEGFVAIALHASKEGRPLYESFGFRPTNEMRLRLDSQQTRG
jgi:GNAT superfamily N-acetyltransferase